MFEIQRAYEQVKAHSLIFLLKILLPRENSDGNLPDEVFGGALAEQTLLETNVTGDASESQKLPHEPHVILRARPVERQHLVRLHFRELNRVLKGLRSLCRNFNLNVLIPLRRLHFIFLDFYYYYSQTQPAVRARAEQI